MGTTYPKIQGRSKTAQTLTVDIDSLKELFTSANDNGMTTSEICDVSGLPVDYVRKLLKVGVMDGIIVRGKRYVSEDWDGRGRNYIVYRMKGEDVGRED